jgi:hypothetical protein
MSYLVRKIERSKWNGSDTAGAPIKADVVASCIRPLGSELSVWFAQNEADIEQAKLAMLAATTKLATIDLVVIPLVEVDGAGLTVASNRSELGPESLKSLHRDISNLDLDSLKKVAQIVQAHLAAGNSKRITRSECKEILQNAIAGKIFDRDELHQDLSSKLDPTPA